MSRALAATGDQRTLMIALALGCGRVRLTHLHDRLPGVSTGGLERYVQQMVTLGLVTRTRFKEMPPRVELELTEAGRELLPIAAALARWGMRNTWTTPAEREHVEIEVLLRILPALLEGHSELRDGRVEAVLTGSETPVRLLFPVDEGCLRAAGRSELADEHATVRVEGDEQAWVAALGPCADRGRLLISGDARLAGEVFAALPRPAG